MATKDTKSKTDAAQEEYLVPSMGVVVMATSPEEAVQKAEALSKSKDE